MARVIYYDTRSGVSTEIQSYIQVQSDQKRAFPIPFRQDILQAGRLWLKENIDFGSCFS